MTIQQPPFLVLAALSGIIPLTSAVTSVPISPGMTIQAAVDSNPAGTTFLIRTGVHRLQQVSPKTGNTFLGEAGTILNGSKVLTGFTKSGAYWIVSGQTQKSARTGECLPSAPRCTYAEDVYFDGAPLKHVRRTSDLGPGKFYFDYTGARIYIAQDPAGHTVEAAVSRSAFDGPASNVTIRGLVVEKYANPGQYGAIMGVKGSNWTIESNEVRMNHGVGIVASSYGKVRLNFVHHNGQLGIAAVGLQTLVEGNEMSYNNTAGYDPGWEGGASKFALTQDLVVRGNRVHHNYGYGLWTDTDNIRTLYENNVVYENEQIGIFHEISYDAVIRNNTVVGNGKAYSPWLWGGQILLAGSQNVEITGNKVFVSALGGNGISLIQQLRGTGRYGPWKTRKNYVHNNDITYEGEGMSGAVADDDESGMLSGGNRFDSNTYHFAADNVRWYWGDEMDLAGMRAAGQERNALVDTVVKMPPLTAQMLPMGLSFSGKLIAERLALPAVPVRQQRPAP